MNDRKAGPQKKKYSPPKGTKVTQEQAIKLVMDGMKCTEQEAKDLLDSLQEQKKEQKEDAA
jgi:hypothetical protein